MTDAPLSPIERLARLAGISRKPKRQAFTWVFDETETSHRMIDGRATEVTATKAVERVITKTEIVHDANGDPVMVRTPAHEAVVKGADGKPEIGADGKPKRRYVPASETPKTVEVPVYEDVECTWDADIAAANILSGPGGSAYMPDPERQGGFLVAVPGETDVRHFTPQPGGIIRLIQEHLDGYPDMRARAQAVKARLAAGKAAPATRAIVVGDQTLAVSEADLPMLTSARIASEGGAAVTVTLASGRHTLRYVDFTRLMEAWYGAA